MRYNVDILSLFSLSLLVGVVEGMYGVGGGVMMSGILVSLFKLPVHVIAGANLFATFVSSIDGFISYSSLGYPPNLFLGLSMGIGGAAGIYVGSRLQKYLLKRRIKVLLALVMLTTSLRYIMQFFHVFTKVFSKGNHKSKSFLHVWIPHSLKNSCDSHWLTVFCFLKRVYHLLYISYHVIIY